MADKEIRFVTTGDLDFPDEEPSSHTSDIHRKLLKKIQSIALDDLKETASDISEAILETFKPRPGGASQCELEFGLAVDGKGNIVVAEISSSMNIKVKVIWK